MSIEETRLSDKQRQYVVDWINSKTPLIGKCPLCGARDWTVLPYLTVSGVWGRNEQLIISRMVGRGYAHANLVCANCGNTHAISATHMGLVVDDNLVNDPVLDTGSVNE